MTVAPARSRQARQRLFTGALQVISADGLALPTGILVAAVLARSIGPDGYGVFALAVSLVTAVEWVLTSLTSRTSVALVGGAADWTTVGSGLLRIHALVGVAAGGLLAASAWPLAYLFDEPRITICLLILAVEVPVVALATACRSLLTGRGRFSARAVVGATRWLVRLVAVVMLVQAGWSVPGAVAGNVVGALAGLVVARALVGRLAPLTDSAGLWRRFWMLAWPTFMLALSLRLFDKVGLAALKALGGTTEDLGFYAAAQNFALAPGVAALSFSQLLLASMSRAIADHDLGTARAMGHDALRAIGLALPLVAILGGSAREVVRLVYGPRFDPAAQLSAPFLVAAVALAVISMVSIMLTAAGYAREATRSAWPLLPVAIVGFVVVMPRFGALGGAVVTSAAALAGAMTMLTTLQRLWPVSMPLATCGRSLIVSLATWYVAAIWPVPGWWWVVKAAILAAGALAGQLALGEFSRAEVASAWAWLRNPRTLRRVN